MPNISKMIWSEVCNLRFYDFATGKYLGVADELQDMSISNEQEDADVLGKNGIKINSLSKSKSMTLSGNSGVWNDFLLGLMTGSDVKVGEALVEKEEIVTVNTNSAKTTYKGAGVAGAEIKYAYYVDAEGNNIPTKEPLVQGASASEGKFAYAPLTGALTFHTDIEDGTRLRVIYKTKADNATTITNDVRKFSKVVTIVGDSVVLDNCSNEEFLAQLNMPKARVSGTYEISLNGEPAVQSFECVSLPTCGQTKLWDLVIADEKDLDKIV